MRALRVVPFALLLLVGCGDDGEVADLAVAGDASASLDLSIACARVATWPGIGGAFFTPLGRGAKDVATVRSNLTLTGGDAGSHVDQLLIEVRTTPGATVTYPRSVSLAAATYEACDECITVGQDLVAGTPGKRFLAQSGTLFMSRVDQLKTGRIELMVGNLRLVEWGANDVAVPGGGCYEIGSATFAFDYAEGPITGQTDM